MEHQYDVRETAERSLSRIVATVPPPEVAADGLLTPASLHDPDALIEGPGTFSTESSQSESYDKVGLGNNARCESIGDSFGDNSLTPHSADPGYTLDYWVSGRPTREGGEDVWRHESGALHDEWRRPADPTSDGRAAPPQPLGGGPAARRGVSATELARTSCRPVPYRSQGERPRSRPPRLPRRHRVLRDRGVRSSPAPATTARRA